MVVLFCKKLPQLWENFLFIREMKEPMMAIQGKLFTTNYTNGVVHAFKVVFLIVSFIYVQINLYFWSRSYSKQSLLWALLREKSYTTEYVS